ncbi:MAG: hypothetical protein KIT61_01595 [Pyrinomonadaceae bacterium]|nr:hypothetical protein [Pyrinomonadaceae bacterium]
MARLRQRPHYTPSDLLIHQASGESSYIPDEFVPHTITGDRTPDDQFEIRFEYPIDEAVVEEPPSSGVRFMVGKYSRKIINITFHAGSVDEFKARIHFVVKLLKVKKLNLTKQSHRKHYDLICGAFLRILDDLENDASEAPKF